MGVPRLHRVRWLGHAAKPVSLMTHDVMVKQLLFAHFIPGHPRHVDGHRHA